MYQPIQSKSIIDSVGQKIDCIITFQLCVHSVLSLSIFVKEMHVNNHFRNEWNELYSTTNQCVKYEINQKCLKINLIGFKFFLHFERIKVKKKKKKNRPFTTWSCDVDTISYQGHHRRLKSYQNDDIWNKKVNNFSNSALSRLLTRMVHLSRMCHIPSTLHACNTWNSNNCLMCVCVCWISISKKNDRKTIELKLGGRKKQVRKQVMKGGRRGRNSDLSILCPFHSISTDRTFCPPSFATTSKFHLHFRKRTIHSQVNNECNEQDQSDLCTILWKGEGWSRRWTKRMSQCFDFKWV